MPRCLLLVLSVLALSGFSAAQDTGLVQDAARTISVYGTGYVEGEADRASVTLEGSGSSLRAAIADTQQEVAETTDALRRLGLEETAFATSRFTGYEGGRPFLFAKREYKSSIALTVTVDDLGLLEAAVLVLSEEPVERIAGIQFALRDLDALRRSAREEALADAQAKAAAMAAGFGLALGPVLRIEEEPTLRQMGRHPVAALQMAEHIVVEYDRARMPEVEIFAERFAVQAGVRVTYALGG